MQSDSVGDLPYGLETEILWLLNRKIAPACSSDRFCPDDNITRGQMAALLSRALDLRPATHDHFNDDTGSAFEDDINRLAKAGITQGCATDNYCPADMVTRGEIAAFIYRARNLL